MYDRRVETTIISAIIKKKAVTKFNKRVRPREFQLEDLVLRHVDARGKHSRVGKLVAKWEGSYRVKASTRNKTYTVEALPGESNPRT